MSLNKLSSPDEKKSAADAVYELLSDFLFEKVNLLNNPTLSVSANTTNTSTYDITFRVPDTGKGLYLRPDKKSRLRAVFYVNGTAEKADFYFLSPVRFQGVTGVTFDGLHSYVGIKSVEGLVSLVSYSDGAEMQVSTDQVLEGENTYAIDIKYNIGNAEVYINNRLLGTIECNLSSDFYNIITLYPVLGAIRSIDGTSVQLTAENFQFLQDK